MVTQVRQERVSRGQSHPLYQGGRAPIYKTIGTRKRFDLKDKNLYGSTDGVRVIHDPVPSGRSQATKCLHGDLTRCEVTFHTVDNEC